MSAPQLVRFGLLGHIGVFQPQDAVRYERGTRVICRTVRGLEVGETLNAVQQPLSHTDGMLLRAVTLQDDLLLARLDRYRNQAYEACCRLLAERGIEAVLMDVEQLFDGESLYFYFLGDITPELHALTEELAQLYETKVQLRRFAETLTAGCGPDCGTENAAGGCGSGGCSTCSVAAACRTGSG